VLAEPVGTRDLDSFRFAIGYANMMPTVVQRLTEKYGITFVDAFGQTETSYVLVHGFSGPGEAPHLRKTPTPLVDVALVDPEMREVPDGTPGECAVRGPGLMTGYLDDPVRGTRCTWHIEAEDPPRRWREDDADLARRFRAAITWVRDQSNMVPLGLGAPNHVDEPYPVQKVTFGWAAGDAAYAMGSFDLQPEEALVIRGRSPECAFWNLCLWNQFMHTYNYDYERCTINGAQTVLEADGSWTIVVAEEDPGHPNWVSTAGHPRGRLWFRWFYPAETPDAPTTEVVKLADVPHRTELHAVKLGVSPPDIRAAGEELLILDRAGRLQLPRSVIAETGLRDRVRVRVEDGRVVLEPGDDA